MVSVIKDGAATNRTAGGGHARARASGRRVVQHERRRALPVGRPRVLLPGARGAPPRPRRSRSLSLSLAHHLSRTLALSPTSRARARSAEPIPPTALSRALSLYLPPTPTSVAPRVVARTTLSTVRGSRRLLLPDGAHVLRVRQDDLRAVELHARPQGRRAARISRRIAPLTNDAHQKSARARRRSPGRDSTGRQAYARCARAEPARARALF